MPGHGGADKAGTNSASQGHHVLLHSLLGSSVFSPQLFQCPVLAESNAGDAAWRQRKNHRLAVNNGQLFLALGEPAAGILRERNQEFRRCFGNPREVAQHNSQPALQSCCG